MAETDWGGANLRFLGLVSVGAARSLDQTALKPSCHQNNPSNDVKYITHMQSVLAGGGGGWICTQKIEEDTL